MTETYISFNGGAYSNRSLIAASQRCVNLYVEPTSQSSGEPYLYTHYPTPGTKFLHLSPTPICRCAYPATNGDLYMAWGQNIYYVNESAISTLVGTMVPSALSDIVPRTTPISMADNGTTLLIVDGSVDGWTVNLATRGGFARIDSATDAQAGWLGSPRIVEQDKFFIASAPNTPNFYVSGLDAVTFDPLDLATKAYQADNIVGIASVQRNIWLLGELTYEVWSSSSNQSITQSFPYEPLPGAVGNWGCAAVGSIATTNNQIFWLTKDRSGKGMIYRGESTVSKRISTHAIEYAISKYPVISDAISYCYQQDGHVFYIINFPSANDFRGVTWGYDSTVDEWHERMTISRNTTDVREWNGIEYRHRIQCIAEAYGMLIGGDWENQNIYQLDLDTYTDNSQPIVHIRSGPHEIDLQGNDRINFKQLQINMQVGTETQNNAVPAITVINTGFVGTDGTLLQNYSNINDTGAIFTKDSGTTNAIILTDTVVGQTTGTAEYSASGIPTTADYLVTFDVKFDSTEDVPTDGSELFVIGRSTGGNGYKASISSDGSTMYLNLIVMGGATYTVEIGTYIASGFYEITLTMISTAITVDVYRSYDSTWLISSGTWSSIKSTAISISDNTYTTAGVVLMGGDWA